MRNNLLLGFLLAAVLLLATADSRFSADRLTVKQMRQAEQLYTTRCTVCHRLYDPASYTEEEWKLWMANMSRKARLNQQQAKLLDRYLNEYRAAAKSGR